MTSVAEGHKEAYIPDSQKEENEADSSMTIRLKLIEAV
jgi:hypothetical protein